MNESDKDDKYTNTTLRQAPITHVRLKWSIHFGGRVAGRSCGWSWSCGLVSSMSSSASQPALLQWSSSGAFGPSLAADWSHQTATLSLSSSLLQQQTISQHWHGQYWDLDLKRPVVNC